MSKPGLSAFVQRTSSPANPALPSNTHTERPDRAFAKELKVVSRKSQAPAALYLPQQHIYDSVQGPTYASNPAHGSRFNGPGTMPPYQGQDGGSRNVLDSDAGSDFDRTRTSVTVGQTESEYEEGQHQDSRSQHGDDFDQEEMDDEQNDRELWTSPQVHGRENHTQAHLPRHQSSSPAKVRRSAPTTTGHHNLGHHRNQSEIPIPSNQTKAYNHKKRSRTDDRPVRKDFVRAGVDEGIYETSEIHPRGAGLLHGAGDEIESEGDPESMSEQEDEVTPTRQLEEDAENAPEEEEDEKVLKIAVQPDSSTHPADYSEEELRKLDYSKLSTESWESTHEDPPDFQLPDHLKGSTLEQRVEHYAFNGAKTRWDEQVAFYQSLNTSDWDAAGEHLLAEIGNIFVALKDAKTQKRKDLERIEAEIEEREKLVRGKSAKIDAKFVAMQVGGEGLLNVKN